eukprot:scaffold1935_cov54-Cylindrotheca_fusiformis.AAC.1
MEQRRNMEERNDPSEFFVYTSETKDIDIPKEELTHLRVDSSVIEIPDETFWSCKKLKYVQIPETLTRIGRAAFCKCSSLKRIQFVSDDTRLETNSINPCLEDGTIMFPERPVLEIGEDAFFECICLRKVIVRSVSMRLGPGVFMDCSSLISVELPEGLQVIEEELFCYCESLRTVNIPSSVIKIGEGAFCGCGSLTSVDLPQGLLELGARSFTECWSIETLHIPSTVSSIGVCTFGNCQRLKHIKLPPALEIIEDSLLADCESLRTVNIPSSVIKIGEGAFCGCGSLTSVDLPQGLLELGARSFSRCWSIETLHIPSTVSSIGVCTFGNCHRLKHIKLPPTLEIIEESLFAVCHRLEYIELPATLKNLRDRAFDSCSSLSHIRIPPSIESIGFESFLYCSSLLSIELPEGILFSADLSDCRSLVNLACKPLYSGQFEQDSNFGGYDELLRNSMHRFECCPVNKLCYYQSYHSSEEAMLQLRSLMEDDPLAASTQVDGFGMTPLHILSLSQTPNINMLLAVMKAGPLDHIIQGRDSFGFTPLYYLCLNRTPKSNEVIRRVLLTRFDFCLGLDRPSSTSNTMSQAIHEELSVDWSSMSEREMGSVYCKLAKYERKEILSLLELYLWKVKINDLVDGSKKQKITDRQSCRIYSGASVVIPHVLPFLDSIDLTDYVDYDDWSLALLAIAKEICSRLKGSE